MGIQCLNTPPELLRSFLVYFFQCSVSLLAVRVRRLLTHRLCFPSRTALSSRPTTLSWCWPTRAPSSSTRSPRPRPECWWTSGGRCLATSRRTWRSGYTHSCQVKTADTVCSPQIICIVHPLGKNRTQSIPTEAESRYKAFVVWPLETLDRNLNMKVPTSNLFKKNNQTQGHSR